MARTPGNHSPVNGDLWPEVGHPLKGKNLANQPFTVVGLNDPATLTLAPRGTPIYQTTYGNVGPRVGGGISAK
jgi:hypothetical protein